VLYGLAIVACTVYFWRTTPAGIMGIAVLCVGDGLAEVVGRQYGRDKLPHNKDKVLRSPTYA
jgi:phytol kinase